MTLSIPARFGVDRPTMERPGADPLLRVRDLETHLRSREGVLVPVKKVSFDVARGETLGLVGESGCGKTMTALSLMGLVPDPPGRVVGGSVVLDGVDLLVLSDRELRHKRATALAMVFQNPTSSLNPTMRVGAQITETMRHHLGLDQTEARRRAIELLAQVDIPSPESRLDNYPHQFSGGMRQRVMIAIAICCGPKLLIADEPTTALDVTVQAQLLDLVRQLKQERAMSVIWITHDLGVVAEICDRVAVMYAGSIVEMAAVEDFFERPRHPYSRALLAAVPTLERRSRDRLASIGGAPPMLARMPAGCPYHPRCPIKTATCEGHVPELEEVEPEHRVACWYPHHDRGG